MNIPRIRLPRRRNYFIDKSYQTRFVLKFLAVLTAGSAASGYVMFSMLDREVEHAFYSSHIKLASTGQLLLPAMLKVNAGVLALVLLFVALITLYLSHRVAAPLSRLGKSAERIAAGDLTCGFDLRDKDELKGLANAFDTMSSELKFHFNALRHGAEDMDRAAEGLLFQHASSHLAHSNGPKDDARRMLSELESRSEEFEKKLAWFKLDS